MVKVPGTDALQADAGTDVIPPPSVLVTDADGDAVEGAKVTFATDVGDNGVIVAPSDPVVTGADGKATLTSWTLEQTVGENNLTASCFGCAVDGNDGP